MAVILYDEEKEIMIFGSAQYQTELFQSTV